RRRRPISPKRRRRGREGSVENMAFSQLTPPVGIRPTRDGGRPSSAAEAFPDLERLNPTATVAFRHCCVGDFSTTVRGGDFLSSRRFRPGSRRASRCYTRPPRSAVRAARREETMATFANLEEALQRFANP